MIRWAALLVGVACLIGAVWINAAYQVNAMQLLILASAGEKQGVDVPNWLPAGTAFGLAIAGGLCVLGACVADCKRPATSNGGS